MFQRIFITLLFTHITNNYSVRVLKTFFKKTLKAFEKFKIKW